MAAEALETDRWLQKSLLYENLTQGAYKNVTHIAYNKARGQCPEYSGKTLDEVLTSDPDNDKEFVEKIIAWFI